MMNCVQGRWEDIEDMLNTYEDELGPDTVEKLKDDIASVVYEVAEPDEPVIPSLLVCHGVR
ncbi:MAG TPA: hypothetical protein DHV37_05955 [Erysipelotrichaceae bacterium]|nr:hypothetical protein [Erysipelotrichaceae bacterium]